MTSKEMRDHPLFLRNGFAGAGKWSIPLVKSQQLCMDKPMMLACSDTRRNDRPENCRCGVHFFVDDYRFRGIYKDPERTLKKFSQYAFLLTPDFSLYADMPRWKQLENVAKNRWCGAYWQAHGLTVIPTISWAGTSSFGFCFDGVEQNAVVAVGMIGCKKSRVGFMRGYHAMLERLNPAKILCFGDPFPEMGGNIIRVDYRTSRKAVR